MDFRVVIQNIKNHRDSQCRGKFECHFQGKQYLHCPLFNIFFRFPSVNLVVIKMTRLTELPAEVLTPRKAPGTKTFVCWKEIIIRAELEHSSILPECNLALILMPPPRCLSAFRLNSFWKILLGLFPELKKQNPNFMEVFSSFKFH